MKTKRFSLFALLCVAAFALLAAKPADFNAGRIDEIWKEMWKSGDVRIGAPKVEKLSEQQVMERMAGKWTVRFGVTPDKLTISLGTNRLVEVSGQKEGTAWKKSGEWRVVSDKLVLFLAEDDLPGFIFKTRGRDYIFDPWSKAMMSELQREK